MVMSEFRVKTGDAEGRADHWFASFLADTWDYEYHNLQEVLNKVDAKASTAEFVNIGDPLIFESEHDFTMFLLKWVR
jgi:hypothetical protein